jgi:hypothetical protein
VPVPGATGATYTPGRDDVGHLLTVSVTGTAPGLAPGTATSPARLVRRAAPAFSEGRANARKRKAGVVTGRALVLRFSVGPWADGGRVTAVLAGKKRGVARVASGTAVVRVSAKGIGVGRHKLVMRYAGTVVAEAARGTYALRVRPSR